MLVCSAFVDNFCASIALSLIADAAPRIRPGPLAIPLVLSIYSLRQPYARLT
jgi:hypothetical protein